MKDDLPLVDLDAIDLRELSERYDLYDTYVSIYFPVSRSDDIESFKKFVNRRSRDIILALEKNPHLVKNFKDTMDMVMKYIDIKPILNERSRVIFASAKLNWHVVYRLPLHLEPMVVLDTSPYIKPLALLRDDYYDYGIVLVNTHTARLFHISTGVITGKKHVAKDIINKHKKGGQSQMRFQRLRKGAIHHFLMGIVDDIQEAFYGSKGKYWRGIILAGPGEAKKLLYDMLPHHIKEDVLDIIDIDMGVGDSELLKLGDKVTAVDERSREMLNVEALRALIFKGYGALYHIDEIARAVRDGRVRVLMIVRGLSIAGYICEKCQNIYLRHVKNSICAMCGHTLSRVDVIEELIEFAERTDCEVEFVKDNVFLMNLGGVAALLRY